MIVSRRKPFGRELSLFLFFVFVEGRRNSTLGLADRDLGKYKSFQLQHCLTFNLLFTATYIHNEIQSNFSKDKLQATFIFPRN